MNKQMRRYCARILWRCATGFLLVLCAITCIQHQLKQEDPEEISGIVVVEQPAAETTPPTDNLELIPLPLVSEQEALQPVEVPEISRYASLTKAEIDLLARIVYLEARGECPEGQQAVAEVVLNRIASPQFPDTLVEVIFQKNQFSTADNLADAQPTMAQYEAIYQAMYGQNILPMDVVFFARKPENDNLWGYIGNHAFCYTYQWEDET